MIPYFLRGLNQHSPNIIHHAAAYIQYRIVTAKNLKEKNRFEKRYSAFWYAILNKKRGNA